MGYKIAKQSGKKQSKSSVDKLVRACLDRGNKLKYIVIYLSPKDYHRFHSPVAFTASMRRHILGYLEPVDPRYLANHRDVLK